YISLARSHFFSVLIVLVGIVGLGVAQDHGSLPFRSAAIPTVSGILIVIGLVLLAVLGRIAIDVTAEPLLETFPRLPAEPVEIGILRRIVTLLEAAHDGLVADNRSSELLTRLPERLVAAFEQGNRSFLDAVNQLSENSQTLKAAMRSSVEALEATMRSARAEEGRVDADTNYDATAFPELQAAVEELTAVLRQFSAMSENTQETTLAGGIVHSRDKAPPPGLARELRRLLQEI